MNMNQYLKSLLKENRITREDREMIKVEVKEELDDLLKSGIRESLGEEVRTKYAGSIAKGTANIVDYDVDILCFFSANSKTPLEKIYETVYRILNPLYVVQRKKSAITITGKRDDYTWDYHVDVVPGKYSDHQSQDAFLYVADYGSHRLKTNPIVQLEKVKRYNNRDIIRLYKLFRYSNNLRLKSFILELFTIDVADKHINDGDDIKRRFTTLLEQIIEKLGRPNLYDPANSGNEVSQLHTEIEYQYIKDRTYRLLQSISKEDYGDLDLIFNNEISKEIIDSDYTHAIKPPNRLLSHPGATLTIECKADRKVKKKIYQATYEGKSSLPKGDKLYFRAIPNGVRIDEVKWLVANSGKEAIEHNCLRGQVFEESNFGKFGREESREYKGKHFIQAIGYKNGNVVVISDRFWVKIK